MLQGLLRRPGLPRATVERQGATATVRLHGDVVIPTARAFYGQLRRVAARREIKQVVLDFSDGGRLDSAGVAVVSLGSRMMARTGKSFDLRELNDHHKAAIALLPANDTPPERIEEPGVFERLGDTLLGALDGATAFVKLVADTARHSFSVITRRKRLPHGAVADQIVTMGVSAVFIVALLSFLLGTSLAFQSAVQLRKLGAGVYVADLVGISFVREFGPLMTAIILTGRTGAAIAAEIGTMRMRSEIDALTVMGVSPIRYHVVPRMAALTVVQPALSLLGMFVGIMGAMLVASFTIDLAPVAFWQRVVARVTLWDFAHGLGKALAFAWIIGFVGTIMGLRAKGDANSVGVATTRAVVTSIFLIIVVDAAFATISTMTGGGG
jgi:phospholipid/cholesterol/gamma-HCH transport system permease protein